MVLGGVCTGCCGHGGSRNRHRNLPENKGVIMTTKVKAWLFALVPSVSYAVMVVVATIVFLNNDINRPFLRALLWPISLTRYLLGGLN